MQKPFKFRYASEIAGVFVLLGLALAVGGILVSGQSQGWFERKFKLHSMFDTEQGAFGLQEGNEVRIRNALAGRVDRIRPTEEGQLKATFIIQDKFRRLISKNATAKIKKKFGIAGDSFVEIGVAGGPRVEDGDFIVCKQDEEITEIARNVLTNLQQVVFPILNQAERTLENLNGIAGSINRGQGLIGSLVNDRELSDRVKDTVGNVNGVFVDSQETLREITRLVRGFQNHWLVKKYIEKPREPGFLVPLQAGQDAMRDLVRQQTALLAAARVANNSRDISRGAYNMAVCGLAKGDYGAALAFADEALAEQPDDRDNVIRIQMLKADLGRKQANGRMALDAVLAALAKCDKSTAPELRIECAATAANVYCDAGRGDEAESELAKVEPLVRKTESAYHKAIFAGARGRILLIKGKPRDAAAEFDSEAALLREVPSYYEMAASLESAGAAFQAAGKPETAADRYFRAGRSWYYGGHTTLATNALARAAATAEAAPNRELAGRIESLQQTIAKGMAPSSGGGRNDVKKD